MKTRLQSTKGGNRILIGVGVLLTVILSYQLLFSDSSKPASELSTGKYRNRIRVTELSKKQVVTADVVPQTTDEYLDLDVLPRSGNSEVKVGRNIFEYPPPPPPPPLLLLNSLLFRSTLLHLTQSMPGLSRLSW